MKYSFLEYIKSNRPVLFDGGMGSLLIDSGMGPDEIPEVWNVEKTEVIESIHSSYLDAGADVILTNTFGGTNLKLATKKIDERMEELNRGGVDIAKKVCSGKSFVAGDIGPTSKFLPPVGNASIEEFYSSYSAQAKMLIGSGVDLILIETQYDLREAITAVQAVRDISREIPIITSMTFEKRKRGFFTIMGDTPKKSFIELEKVGANIVGINCTLSSADMVDLFREVKQSTTLPTICQPNAGQPEVVEGKVTYPQTPENFADDIMKIVDLGADIIGGCCGT
ncbi:MAG: homocysteine S-methyltransferase family protein, partial [Candidatus Kariarchaeaceae archaeon]